MNRLLPCVEGSFWLLLCSLGKANLFNNLAGVQFLQFLCATNLHICFLFMLAMADDAWLCKVFELKGLQLIKGWS